MTSVDYIINVFQVKSFNTAQNGRMPVKERDIEKFRRDLPSWIAVELDV